MDDIGARLARCFAAVFPNLTPDQILSAEPSRIAGWDSVASVTLIATIEEEFEIELEVENLAELLSFKKLRAYLRTRSSASRAH